jgi:hypothetical protein
MPNVTRNFIAGRMNKIVDQRLLPDGEYVDAMNIRMGSTENSEVGVVENTKGNVDLATLVYLDGTQLSTDARCIGAIDDSANETIYWFVHDPNFEIGATGKLDLIVSYNVFTTMLTYHVISIDDGSGVTTTLNFNPSYLITGVNIIDNLLFWTDNYNPPRFINVSKNYSNPVSDLDEINHEEILVIKRPPVESPKVTPLVTSGQENYLETRFISFAYRYRYADGEYSATSQWSAPAFAPKSFQFNISSMLNEGMTNFFNAAVVEYNTGGPLVVGIDLLFKQSNNNIIKIIQKINKQEAGFADNQTRSITFNNSKIFTILNESEILRLYDSVPLLAKAQTIMGNRLMYGNYVEGYDLIDKNGYPTRIEYLPEIISEEIGTSTVNDTTGSGDYTINTALTIPDSIVYIDLVGLKLIKGSFISLEFTFTHNSFSGTPEPTETTENIQVTFDFPLNRNYSSVYDLASSVEFQDAVGSITNIEPMSNACNGITFTDRVNCLLPTNLDALIKVGSGISGINQPIKIITTPASNEIGLQLCATKYVDDIVTPTVTIYEYYEIVFSSAIFQEIGNPKSLHSNRGYEIGIVYMDGFNRSTTALVSSNNAVYIPCGFSDTKNSVRVTIPFTQIAPAWAKRYKFVIKPDEENYETIYCNLFFTDPNTNEVWFYLEGENAKKVETGDRLIVKADTDGPRANCAYATILLKEAKASGFIEPVENIVVPSGLYVKINPNSFSAVIDPEALVNLGAKSTYAFDGNYAMLEYPINEFKGAGFDPLHPSWEYKDYSIPAGSIITLDFNWDRPGTGNACEKRGYVFKRDITVSADYDNFQDWWNGDNISALLNTGTSRDGQTELEYISANGILTLESFSTMYLQFYTDPVTNKTILQMTTGAGCRGWTKPRRRQYYLYVTVQILRAINTIIFETEPQDALPDVFFENELSFAIDEDGNHMGNVQDQDIAGFLPAIVDTEFFNCFAFGNGAESYKIRDSIIGRSFNLGERVTTVSAQDYKQAHRFSDIIYSGVYNNESNINGLNQFNSGLLNFKHCEASFGEIQLLDGRNTDVLVLQEDKISYVLAEKNLLSDASAGGVVTATPEVLGTQIARTEKYGISFNPESYVQWGHDRFFTDAKRGAVLQLKGGDAQNEQLVAISEQNMRTWFRDKFNDSFNTQKLGGFDPYMNEYVLVLNDQLLPINPECVRCGVSQTFTLSSENLIDEKQETYCVDLGSNIGVSDINWVFTNIQEGGSIQISVNYNGVIVDSTETALNGSISFNKNNISIETAQITITYKGDMVVSITSNCPISEEVKIVEVVLTDNSDAGKTIHTQYRYVNDTFVGPLLSNLVLFEDGAETPLVSRYNLSSGFAGQGAYPPAGSTMILSTNKINPDDFVFNSEKNKFRYLRSSILYENNSIDIQDLINESATATPISGGPTLYYSSFTTPDVIDGEYLYLIWDLRTSVFTELCYSSISKENGCCDCTDDNYYLGSSFTTATSIFTNSDLTVFAANGFYSLGGIVRELVDGVLLPQQNCPNCGVPCGTPVATPGGTGITDLTVFLDNPEGGIIIFDFKPQGVPDKLEIIHVVDSSYIKKSTTSMTAANNSGPFDNDYGTRPTNVVPDVTQANATNQFIGTDKGTVPTRMTEFETATGITTLPLTPTYQQRVWWEYSAADYELSNEVNIRITGISGTAWTAIRVCLPIEL